MHNTRRLLLAEGHQGPNLRFGAVTTFSAALGSTLVAWALHRWWRRRQDAEGDEKLFDDLTGSPLFDSNVVPPARSTVKETHNEDHAVGAIGTLSVAEREEALQLARGLLRQLHGEQFNEEESAAEGSDTEETNVSLNYYIATEMEKEARNSLVEAVVQGDLLKMKAQGKSFKLSDFDDVLRNVVEYLSISNDREKLRERRNAMHSEAPHNHGIFGENGHDRDDCVSQRVAAINEAYADCFLRPTELDRRLCAPCDDNEMTERFEMGWDSDDDGGAEADLMAYLDQDDAAGYGSRIEARLGAMQGHRMHGMDFDDEMYFDGHDDGYVDVIEDEEDSDDIFEKANFERMLISRLEQLVAAFGQKNTTMGTPGHSRNGRQRVYGVGQQEGAGEDEWETESDDGGDDGDENN